jgi:hypothetical protein
MDLASLNPLEDRECSLDRRLLEFARGTFQWVRFD